MLIPFAPINSQVDSAIITWNRDFQIDYISVVPISYSGFTITELQLNDTYHPMDIDSYQKILDVDQSYLELDSLYQFELTFNSIVLPPQGYARDYIILTTGRYDVPEGDNFLMQMSHQYSYNIPYKNKLFANYPNPFNPVTKIRYEISKASLVKVKIYNVLGEEIKLLVNEYKNAGNYDVSFDGTKLPSGIYFYRLETPYFSDTKKMVLIK